MNFKSVNYFIQVDDGVNFKLKKLKLKAYKYFFVRLYLL